MSSILLWSAVAFVIGAISGYKICQLRHDQQLADAKARLRYVEMRGSIDDFPTKADREALAAMAYPQGQKEAIKMPDIENTSSDLMEERRSRGL